MRATVLVADDDEILRDGVSWILGSAGFRVLTAADGAEAIRRSAKADVDIFVLDLHMPVLDGVETLAGIRAKPRFRDTPVLFVTGSPQDAPAGMAALAKPCTAAELLAAVTSLLPTNDAERPTAEAVADRRRARRGSATAHRTGNPAVARR